MKERGIFHLTIRHTTQIIISLNVSDRFSELPMIAQSVLIKEVAQIQHMQFDFAIGINASIVEQV
jgi:hypothetical protein